MDFGKAIRVARSIADLSQRELAEVAEVDASLISLIESGKRQPSAATLKSISNGLHIPLHLLTMLGAEPGDLRHITGAEFQRLSESITRFVLQNEPRFRYRHTRRRRTAKQP